MTLFRKEALEHQQEKFWGEAVILMPPSYVFLSWFFVVMIAIGLVFLNTGEYAKKQAVRGFIAPTFGYVKVKATEDGEVTKLWVKENESVQKGQILAVISRTQMPGNDIYYKLLNETNLQKNMLEQSRSHAEQLAHLQEKKLVAERDAITSDLVSLNDSLKLLIKKMALTKEQYHRIQTLHNKGMASRIELDQAKHALLAVEQEQVQLENQITRKAKYAHEMEQNILENRQKIAQSHTDYETRLSQLKEKGLEIDSNRSVSVIAPMDGIVTQVLVRTGDSVNRSDLLFDFVRKEDAMRITLLVPSSAMGFVEKNQAVKIKLDAYPYQKFGVVQGVVEGIGMVSKTPNRLNAPFLVEQSMYEVLVKMDSSPFFVKKNADSKEEVHFQYGMTLRADIVFDQRTLIEWLLDPILSVRA